MKLPIYPNYKPSHVDWLGDVPAHWTVKKLGHEARLQGGFAFKSEIFDTEGVPVIQMNSIKLGRLDLDQAKRIADAQTVSEFALDEGDILMGMTGSLDNIAIVRKTDLPAQLNQRVGRFVTFGNLEKRFLWFMIQSDPFRQQIYLSASGTAQLNISPSQVEALAFCHMPSGEQRAIANFLDRETARLDTLVGKKRELIEKLKEKRTALISRTVTRGLPPAAARAAGLNPHPKLKPSGIEWLGDIPEHWEVRKFSREIVIAEGQVDPEVEPYISMLLIAPNHIESATGRLLARESAADQGAESGKYLCAKDDVVYSKIRPALAKATIAPEDCLCSADMYPLNSLKRFSNPFVFWLLLSPEFTAWSILESDRVAMPKINRETLGELRMPTPPLAEQHAIAEYLDHETAKLDRLMEKVEAAVEKLQEYRTALITAAVTGKIDVRGVSK